MPSSNPDKHAGPEQVTLTNVGRRPLLVQLPTGTVRLGPGARQNIPASSLATAEIRRLCQQRLLGVSPTAEPAPPKAEGEGKKMDPVSPAAASAPPKAGGGQEKSEPAIPAAESAPAKLAGERKKSGKRREKGE